MKPSQAPMECPIGCVMELAQNVARMAMTTPETQDT